MEDEVAEHFRTPFLIGKIIKYSLIAFVIAINALVLWRVFFSANIPKNLDTLQANDAIVAAYNEHGNDLFLGFQDQYSVNYDKGREGYFGVPTYVFIPEANQVQLVFRYNNSTLRKLAKDYGMEDVPDKADELFDVTLLHVTDLTPEDTTDNEQSKVRIQPTTKERETTMLYTYYRYVFDGVTVDENAASSVFVDVYYNGDLNYEQSPYGTLRLYDHLSPWITRDLTAADKKALGVS
jgi:hypothetical protein